MTKLPQSRLDEIESAATYECGNPEVQRVYKELLAHISALEAELAEARKERDFASQQWRDWNDARHEAQGEIEQLTIQLSWHRKEIERLSANWHAAESDVQRLTNQLTQSEAARAGMRAAWDECRETLFQIGAPNSKIESYEEQLPTLTKEHLIEIILKDMRAARHVWGNWGGGHNSGIQKQALALDAAQSSAGVHSCHSKCDNPACVARREHDSLRDALREVEGALNWIGAIRVAPKESWPTHEVIGQMANEAIQKLRLAMGRGM